MCKETVFLFLRSHLSIVIFITPTTMFIIVTIIKLLRSQIGEGNLRYFSLFFSFFFFPSYKRANKLPHWGSKELVRDYSLMDYSLSALSSLILIFLIIVSYLHCAPVRAHFSSAFP